jgi:DNA-binding MarR family transcriptional regulator
VVLPWLEAGEKPFFGPDQQTRLAYNKHSYYVDGMSDDIGFLLGDAARLLRRSFDERARAVGVTRPQWRVLALLKRFDGSTQVSMADMLDVEPITLGRMIDRLQESGLVERRADPKDRRAWRLHLTPLGESRIDALRPTALALFEDALAGLDDNQRTQLESMLDTIRANLTRKPLETAHG